MRFSLAVSIALTMSSGLHVASIASANSEFSATSELSEKKSDTDQRSARVLLAAKGKNGKNSKKFPPRHHTHSPTPSPTPSEHWTSDFDGYWHSHYQIYSSHQKVNAELSIDGDHGTYRTKSFTGNLYNITYHDSWMEGQWYVGSKYGWFKFEMDMHSHTFSGTWGYYSNTEAAGSWDGSR